MLAALVVVLRTVALICSEHRAVALENLALRQQLAVFRRSVKPPPLRVEIAYFGCCSPTPGGSGAQRSSSCTRIPSCAGIDSGSAADGRSALRELALADLGSDDPQATGPARGARRGPI